MCPICGLEVETTLHILWECPSAMDVWRGSCKKIQKSSYEGRTFISIFKAILSTYSEDEVNVFVGLERQVRFRRNDYIHEGSFPHPNVLVRKARSALADYDEASSSIKGPVQMESREKDFWKAPS
jgi:hypothetical protein